MLFLAYSSSSGMLRIISESELGCLQFLPLINVDGIFSAMYSFEISQVNADGGWGDINTFVPFAYLAYFSLLPRVSRCSGS